MAREIVERKIQALLFSFKEISPENKEMFERAVEVRNRAQAPYSNFHVGVAVLSASKKIYSGCNVERVSWTQTTHAEQNAIDSMVAAEGPTQIVKLALVAGLKGEEVMLGETKIKPAQYYIADIPVPCGHCLQIIWENCFNDSQIPLMALMPDGRVSCVSIGDALPMRFGPADLGVDYSKIRGGA